MKCTEARETLPGLLYGDLPPAEATEVEKHLADCPACGQEYAALQQLRRMLDSVPAPPASVDLRRLYGEAARLHQKRLRRWRRTALALLATAAGLLMALGLRLEIRLEARQVVVRWGMPPAEAVVPGPKGKPAPGQSGPPQLAAAVSAEDVQLVKDLIRALAADVEARDQRWLQALARLRDRLDLWRWQTDQRWNATERDVAALYTAHFKAPEKGANP